MPFTSNTDFKRDPRILVAANRHTYRAADGRTLYDSFSGLWTSGLGHCHPKVSEAVAKQIATLDYAMSFQAGADVSFELANRLSAIAPGELRRVFFANSGSEAADTSLKIALAYHFAKGSPKRTRLVGRERGYHGVNFGGMSVGGISANRAQFANALVPGVDHLPHTHNLSKSAFSRGQPEWGGGFADALEELCARHGAETIAAVIVEPVAGSTGVLPPPKGYLQRLREITAKHGILLIFDEVITAFGRVGSWFAADRFGVVPDMITLAKGLTNGAVPMGAVLVREDIYDAVCAGHTQTPELFHGYTYSGHPVAAAAALAALDAYDAEGAFETGQSLAPVFEEVLHSFDNHPKVLDVRNIGLMGAIELHARPASPGARGLDVHKHCFWREDLVVRNGGDTLQFAPFLNADPIDVEAAFAKVRRAIDAVE